MDKFGLTNNPYNGIAKPSASDWFSCYSDEIAEYYHLDNKTEKLRSQFKDKERE